MKFKNAKQRAAVMCQMKNKGGFTYDYSPNRSNDYIQKTVLKTKKNKLEFFSKFPETKASALFVAQSIALKSKQAKAEKTGYEPVTIGRIKQMNELNGNFFFSKSSKRFFNSKNESKGFRSKKTGDTYFVTSEQFDSKSPRNYTVRKQHKAGNIDTVGEFNKITSKSQAVGEAKRLAGMK